MPGLPSPPFKQDGTLRRRAGIRSCVRVRPERSSRRPWGDRDDVDNLDWAFGVDQAGGRPNPTRLSGPTGPAPGGPAPTPQESKLVLDLSEAMDLRATLQRIADRKRSWKTPEASSDFTYVNPAGT